ncbi:MAG: hypothetical protein EBR28_13285 [Planctomycetia bacterium]|nr:hypothetical protein [Planctomycetia bacterium]
MSTRQRRRRGTRRAPRLLKWFELCERRLAMSSTPLLASSDDLAGSDGSLPRFDIGSPAVVDLWVDPAAGSDASAGLSRTQPLRTLSEAWRRVPSRDAGGPAGVPRWARSWRSGAGCRDRRGGPGPR